MEQLVDTCHLGSFSLSAFASFSNRAWIIWFWGTPFQMTTQTILKLNFWLIKYTIREIMIYPCWISQIKLLNLKRCCIVAVQSDTCMRLEKRGIPGFLSAFASFSNFERLLKFCINAMFLTVPSAKIHTILFYFVIK